MGFDQSPEFGEVADAMDGLAVRRKVGCELRKIAACARQPPQRGGRSINPEFLFHQIQQHAPALGRSGRGNLGASQNQRAGLPENPGIPETAASDRHGIGPGFRKVLERILRHANAAAPGDGNLQGLLHPRNDRPVGTAHIRLSHASCMDIHGRSAGLLGPAGNFDGRFGYSVGTGADLECHGNRHSADHRGDDPFNRQWIGQERTPFIPVQEPLDRAFEIEIDDVEAALLDDAGRLSQDGRVGPADLPSARRLCGKRVEQLHRPPVAAGNVCRVDPLGADQRRPELLHHQTKRKIRVLLHRSQNDRMGDADRTDFHGGGMVSDNWQMYAIASSDSVTRSGRFCVGLLMHLEYLAKIAQIIVIDVVLSGDNAVVIAMAAHRLPLYQRKRAILWGGGIAIFLRIVFTLIMAFLLMVPGVRLMGGIVLVWIACKLLLEEDEHEVSADNVDKSTWAAIRMIFVADFVMSLDNMLAVAGAGGENPLLLLFGLVVSIGIIMTCSALIARLMNQYKWIVYVGAAILAFTAGEMILGDRELAGYFARTHRVSLNGKWEHDFMLTRKKVAAFKNADDLPSELRDRVRYHPGQLEFVGQMTEGERDALLERVDQADDKDTVREMYEHSHYREVPDWVPEGLRKRVEMWFQRKWPAEVWNGLQGRQYHYVAWIFYGLVVAFCMAFPYWKHRRAAPGANESK